MPPASLLETRTACPRGSSPPQPRAAPSSAATFGIKGYRLSRRAWLVGVVVSLGGNILAALALGRGGVALVEPLFTVRLLFAASPGLLFGLYLR